MKSLEKLRMLEGLSERDAEVIMEIADEIEREISERYMLLPVDADGVPIRVGDMIERDEDGFCVIGVAPKLCFVQDGLIAPAKPMYYRHVKPRTLEFILEEFAANIEAFDGNYVDAYAAEIRELLGVGE